MSSYRFMRLLYVAGLVVGVVGISAGAMAAPVQWPGNGHWYELVPEPISWQAAKQFAESQDHNGLPGYLVTITSQAENDFVADVILVPLVEDPDKDYESAIWMGGFQPAASPEPAGSWQWVTVEIWNFTNWNTAEPNDLGGSEDCLSMYTQYASASQPLGTWNDASCDYRYVFVIEYSPEPAAVALLALGGLIALKRRR